MNILYLGHENSSILDFLRQYRFSNGDKETYYNISVYSQKITSSSFIAKFDYIISYGYRHIVSKKIIDSSRNGIINLHASYLPWNKGAHPNFCSFIDKIPKMTD